METEGGKKTRLPFPPLTRYYLSSPSASAVKAKWQSALHFLFPAQFPGDLAVERKRYKVQV